VPVIADVDKKKMRAPASTLVEKTNNNFKTVL